MPFAVASVTNGDNSNIMIARVAKETYGIERVVARIYDPRRAAIYERLGIPTVATVQWTIERVLRRILPESHAVEWIDPSAKVCLLERQRPADVGGPRCRRARRSTARSRSSPCPDSACRSCARPNLVIQDGDLVYAAVNGDKIGDVRRTAERQRDCRSALMRVVIAGGGKVGTFIASELHSAGHDVLLVEVDPDRVRQAESLNEPPGVPWLLADACEVSEFARADPEKADVVAAVTGDDEDNLVISLLAKQEFAVPRGRRSRQQPEERLDVQRDVGRRRVGVHARIC